MKIFSIPASALVLTFFCFFVFTKAHAQIPIPPLNANCGLGCSCSTSYAAPCNPGNTNLPCLVSACSTTGNYNCHQYTRMLKESSNPCSNLSSSISFDNRYVRVCDANAPIVYYTNDHSAVRQFDGTYVSKWNCNGDLMRHTRDYYPGSQEYYVYVGPITGSCPLTSGVCTLTQARTFSLVSISGLTYAWSVSNPALVSISGSGSSITLTPICPGTVTLTVNATGCNQYTKTQTMTIVSNPANPGPGCCFSGTYTKPNGSVNALNTTNAVPTGNINTTINNYPGATCFKWTKTSGNNIPFFVSNSGKSMQLTMGSGQSISFSVAAKSGANSNCDGGTTLCTRSITYYQSNFAMAVQSDGSVSDFETQSTTRSDGSNQLESSFRLFPNPSDGLINIVSNYRNDFTIQMYDMVGALLLESQFPAGTEMVTIQAPENINNSLVILKISDGKQSASYKQWIIR